MSRLKIILFSSILFLAPSFLMAQKALCPFGITTTVTPEPENCQFHAGDTVEFCFTLGGFLQSGSNWLHGFVFDIGSGWDENSIKITTDFFISKDSIPGNNYGDENKGFCIWYFCFKVKAKDVPSDDMHFGIRVTSDGITGLWGNAPGCSNDSIFPITHCDAPTSISKCQLNVSFTKTQPSCSAGGELTVVSNTQGQASYLWSNGGTDATITGLAPGAYTVTITDAQQCFAVASDTLYMSDSAKIDITINKGISCKGKCDAKLSANVLLGTQPYTYQWSWGATIDTVSAICTGMANVTFTDAHGCKDSASVIVLEGPSPVEVSTAKVDASCYGRSDGVAYVQVSDTSVVDHYTWTNNVSTGTKAENLAAGTYTITVTTISGCISVGSITVEQPAKVVIGFTTTDIKCNGSHTGEITATGISDDPPYTYRWNINATTATISNLAADTYKVTVTDHNGCTADSVATITEPTQLQFSPAVKSAGCGGGSGYIAVHASGGTPPYAYSWNTAATADSIGNLDAGTYAVTISDDNDCSGTFTAVLGASGGPDVKLYVTPEGCDVLNNGSLSTVINGGTPPYKFLWSNNATTDSITHLNTGTYIVTVTDKNDCSDTASAFVPELYKLILDMYPNPAATVAYVGVTPGMLDNGTIEIYAADGRLMYGPISVDILPCMDVVKLNLSQFANGVYFFYYRSDKTTFNYQFVVNRQ